MRSRESGFLFFLLAGWLSGCAGIPFEPVRLSTVTALDPAAVRESFKGELPGHFSVLESAVIHYRGHDFTALGYSEADESSQTLAVAGVTPLGVKLFEVKEMQGQLTYSFSLPQLKKKIDPQAVAEAVAGDVRNIYFDRVPAQDAEVFKRKDRISFRQLSGKGRLEFFFGGPGTRLIEKRYSEGGRKVWTVRYFDYRTENSKIYPSKIFFEQHLRNYNLTLRLKEILA
jgi:hypothetical protein